jgi:hypothetical protein
MIRSHRPLHIGRLYPCDKVFNLENSVNAPECLIVILDKLDLNCKFLHLALFCCAAFALPTCVALPSRSRSMIKSQPVQVAAPNGPAKTLLVGASRVTLKTSGQWHGDRSHAASGLTS